MDIIQRFRINHNFQIISIISIFLLIVVSLIKYQNTEIQNYLRASILFLFYILSASKEKNETEKTFNIDLKSSFYSLSIFFTTLCAFLFANLIGHQEYYTLEIISALLGFIIATKIISKITTCAIKK